MENKHDLSMCCGTTCSKFKNQQYVEQLERQNTDLLNELFDFSEFTETVLIDGFEHRCDRKTKEYIQVLQNKIDRMSDNGVIDYE